MCPLPSPVECGSSHVHKCIEVNDRPRNQCQSQTAAAHQISHGQKLGVHASASPGHETTKTWRLIHDLSRKHGRFSLRHGVQELLERPCLSYQRKELNQSTGGTSM